MALNYVTLTIDLFDGAGSHANGGIATFTPSVQLTDATDHEIITQAPVTASFKPTGSPAVLLLATDNGNVAPSGWAWTVTFTGVPGNPASFSFFLPFSGGSTQNLSAISPVSTAVTQYPSWPGTTLGDTVYGGASPAGVPTRLPGNTTTTREFLRQQGTGSASAAPAWDTVQVTDLVAAAGTGTTTSVSAPLLYGAVWGYKYKFYPDSYGCLGNGKFVTDGVMTTGTPTALACTSSSPFAAGDVGKGIMVSTAAGTYTGIRGQISAFTDSAHVTLSASATANTSGTPGSIVLYGTDDTANMQSCWNAADAYAAIHGEAEVCYDPTLIYVADAGFAVGGGTLGNAQLFFPNVTQTGLHYSVFHNGGTEDSSPYPNWLQLVPQFSGATIASTRVDGSHNGTYGDSHVIGSAINGMGGESGGTGWSNFHPVVKGLTVITPYNSGAGCMDLFAIASCNIASFSAFTASVVPTSSAPMPNMASASHITNQQGYGLRLPSPGNDASVRVGMFRAQGLTYGLGVSEWSHVENMHAMYCIIGLAPYAAGVTAVHLFEVDYAQIENCSNAMGMADTGTVRGRVRHLGAESISNMFYDPSSQMHVDVGLAPQNSEGSYKSGGFMQGGSGGTNLGIYNIMTRPGPISSPQAPPSSTSAWPNYYYTNLWVELSVSGGTLSALSVTAAGTTVSKTLPGSATTYAFSLPAGASYTPTYTGTLSHGLTVMSAA